MEGVRFKKREYTFNGSKVGRMFSYSKIDYSLEQNARESIHQEEARSRKATEKAGADSIVSGLGGLFDILPTTVNNENQE